MDAILKEQYEKNGYVVIKNLVSAEYIQDLLRVVVNVFYKFNPKQPELLQTNSWSDPLFNASLLKFRTDQPQVFGYFFDTVQTSIELWRLGSERKIAAIAAELMNDQKNILSVTDLLLRMDAPSDTRNKLDWHQDSSYFRQNDLGENGCVCSITMKDLTLDDGPLEILSASHKVGRIDVQSSGKNNEVTSEQFRVPLDIVQQFSTEKIILNIGDAIFFNFDLIHRSGYNAAKLFRFTAIARYHRMLATDFKAGRLVYRQRNLAATTENIT